MKIAICGSMGFAKEMIDFKKKLEGKNHKIIIQEDIEIYAKGKIKQEDKWRKIKIDPFKKYFKEIKNSDAILIVNVEKNKIENYIGGNSLIEMAFAYILNKKIYLLNPIPKLNYADEIEAMKPIIINKNLSLIK